MTIKVQANRITTTESMKDGSSLCHICKRRVSVVGRTPDGKQACTECFPTLKGLVRAVSDDAR